MFTSGSSQMMHSPGVSHGKEGWRVPACFSGGVRNGRNIFALPLLVDEGNLCAPRISQMSLRESWEVRASFSASPARTLASSLSLIFIHVCFPPGNFYQSIQPAWLLPVGTGLKLTCPPGSRNGSDCGAWPGRRFRSWREST